MKTHFEQMAAYNAWANARLYGAAFELDDADYRRDVGAFFKSLSGTLNHLLVADRIWMRRLTGVGHSPGRVDETAHEELRGLAQARVAEDERIVNFVGGLSADGIDRDIEYQTTSGKPFHQPLRQVLAHFFNHQTHHRGQAHTILSIVTGREPPSLDLLQMQRGAPAPDLRALASRASVA
jgi:uncharacterized damage-inducible protein DinB